MNALVYVDIEQGIYKVKLKVALKWKTKKTMWVFFFYKYGKFWSILPDKKVDLKPLFSEECNIRAWISTVLLLKIRLVLCSILKVVCLPFFTFLDDWGLNTSPDMQKQFHFQSETNSWIFNRCTADIQACYLSFGWGPMNG